MLMFEGSLAFAVITVTTNRYFAQFIATKGRVIEVDVVLNRDEWWGREPDHYSVDFKIESILASLVGFPIDEYTDREFKVKTSDRRCDAVIRRIVNRRGWPARAGLVLL